MTLSNALCRPMSSLYRINRACEMTGIDLSDASTREYLTVSFLLADAADDA